MSGQDLDNKKYNLLFDATILTNELYKNSARSGIFFVAKNIFEEFLKRDDINLYLYCDLRKYKDLKKYLKLHNLKHLNIINSCDYGIFENLKYTFVNLKNKIKKKKNPIKRALASLFLSFSSLLLILKDKIFSNKKFVKYLGDIDFYFSPCKQVPRLIKQQQNIISSVYLHDVIPLILPEYFPGILSRNYWFCKLLKELDNKELYFANSECTKKDFLKYVSKLSEDQIKIAYLAASDEFKDLRNSPEINQIKEKYNIPDGKYIFSLCTLDPRKNLIFAIKNFVNFIAKNNINDLYFVLSGGEWESFEKVLNNEIENLNKYKTKIIKTGYVDDEDLPYLYSNAFCFTYISHYEGFGLPVLEAMKCGVPVITSNVSSLPEVIGDAGIKINPNSDEECLNAFEELYFNEEKRKSYSNLGLERAKEFSWRKCTNIIIKELKRRKQND